VSEEDGTTYRILRHGVRQKRPTEPSTPRALAEGSGEVEVSFADVEDRDVPLPTATEVTPPPPAVLARTRARPGLHRDDDLLTFGTDTIRVRHYGGVVHLELPNGTRLSGSDDDACALATLLLRVGARRP
jgi:hypothetical protein